MKHECPTDPAFESVACPVCGPYESTIWLSSNGPARYRRCQGCGTVYASPRSSMEVRHAWMNESFGVGENAIRNAHSRLPVLRMEAESIQAQTPGGRILDVGCDLGDFLTLFPADHWERNGLELSPSAAAFAENHAQAKVVAGMLVDTKFPDHNFDVLTLIDVVYYLDDPTVDFAEVRRILRPGGLFVIEIPGQSYQLARSKGLLCLLADGKWSRVQPDGAYLLWFSTSSIHKLLNKSGFVVTGYEVIPGSPQENWLIGVLTKGYFDFVKKLTAWTSSALTLAPKYLLYATPRGITAETIVRRAGLEDVPQIVDLHSRLIRADEPTSRERRILSIYYSELLRRPDCAIHVAECTGEVVGYSSLIRGHRQLLTIIAFIHPISLILFAVVNLSRPKLWRRFFTRIFQELFFKKFPKGTRPLGVHSELRSIAVDPKQRGSGLALRLLEASLAQMQRAGGRRCIAWVASKNIPSLRLFEKAGFFKLTTPKDGGSEVHILQWDDIDGKR